MDSELKLDTMKGISIFSKFCIFTERGNVLVSDKLELSEKEML